jgi:glycosyltransferase involved in cell wall biosynthesis
MTATATKPDVERTAGPRASAALRLAYLTTKYPAVSHTFIRRELLEIESRGHSVLRLAIRSAGGAPVDPVDVQEEARTLHCLSQPKSRLLVAVAGLLLTSPAAFVRGLGWAIRLARRSDRGLVRHLAYFVEASYLLRVLRRERIEHVHVHFGTNAAAVAVLIRRMGGPRYSMTVHGPDEFDAVMGLSLPEKVAGAEFVAAISDFCASQIKRWSPPEYWGKVHVVHCTVGPDFFDAALPVDPRSSTLLCIGRLSAQKGHPVLIDAFARVVQARPDARLVLAGDGELRHEVESAIAAAGLRDHIHITGWIDEAEIRRQLLASRVLVLASFAEGLPMVIMEAFALGRAVIATQIAGIPELVRPGENGWLVPPGRADALAAAMLEALNAPARRLDDMAAAGRRAVAERHATQTECDRLESLFVASHPQENRA